MRLPVGYSPAVPASSLLPLVLLSAALVTCTPAHDALILPPRMQPAPATVPSARAVAIPARATRAAVPRQAERGDSLPRAAAPAAGPLTFETAAPDGSWAYYCQARTDTDGDRKVSVTVAPDGQLGGDALARYLALAWGGEHRIDDLLASSRDGQRVLFRQGSNILWLEAPFSSPVATDLPKRGADLRREPGSRHGHRTLLLDGRSLLYARVAGHRHELVDYHLDTGAERVLFASEAPIVRFRFEEAAHRIVIDLPGADVNGNGRFEWPFAPSEHAEPCSGPLPRYRAAPPRADGISSVIIDRTSGRGFRVGDLVATHGRALLRRDREGVLFLERDGRNTVVADRRCEGRSLWSDGGRDLLLIGCTNPKKPGRLQVDLVAGARRTALGIDVAALGVDESVSPAERLVPLYPGADTVLFDADTRRLHRMAPGDLVLGTHAGVALVRRGRSALLFDADKGASAVLTNELDARGTLQRQKQLIYASPFVFDLSTREVLGSVPGRGLALSTSGAVLLPARAATASSLAEGPLAWTAPQRTPESSSVDIPEASAIPTNAL